LLNEVTEQEYDILDLNSNFYKDVCTPFTSEKNTDILLNDRINYYYYKIAREATCPLNCKFDLYISENNYLKCKCEINNEDINTEISSSLNKYLGYDFKFLDDYKFTSYKTMKCYNLVFSMKYFIKNIGSIFASILVLAYLFFMIYFIMKDISPLKLQISRMLFDEKEEIKFIDTKINTINTLLIMEEKNKINKKKKLETKSVKSAAKPKIKNAQMFSTENKKKQNSYPPKKLKGNKAAEKKKENKNIKLIDVVNKKKKIGKSQLVNNKKVEFDLESVKSDKVRKRKSIIDYQKEKKIRMLEEKERAFVEPSDNKLIKRQLNKKKEKDNITETGTEIKYSEHKKDFNNKILDDYELNHLEYDEACQLDKRGFCKTYWSIIKREELILSTFASSKDYNLFYIKIEKFVMIILTLFLMNGLLFADKSIHIFFINGVKYNLINRILQIILSIIITHFMEIILCFFTMTDRYIYSIRALPKHEVNGNKIFEVLKSIRRKLIIFIILMLFVSLFCWYFISAFCAVYKNTQRIYILDCIVSFLIFLIDPFVIYAFLTVLRIVSISKICNKKVKCLYKFSRLFPIF
jgi:hypothetical protein